MVPCNELGAMEGCVAMHAEDARGCEKVDTLARLGLGCSLSILRAAIVTRQPHQAIGLEAPLPVARGLLPAAHTQVPVICLSDF